MAEASPKVSTDVRSKRSFVLGSLSFGHGVSHLFDQGFPLVLTEISATMGFGSFQQAVLFGIRQGGSALVSLGGGPVVDMMKPRWGIILTCCMIGAAAGFIFMGASPNLWVLAVAVAVFSIPGSLWHLPSGAALSQRFADRRGFAISIHGFGANMGNAIGPILAGTLLGILLWRYVYYIYAIPCVLVAAFVWWSLKDLGKYGQATERIRLSVQFREALSLLKEPVVVGLTMAAMLRGIGLDAIFSWTPFYLKDTVNGLGMENEVAGLYVALVTGMGIVSTPVLGSLSDRYGRKAVLVPGLAIAAVLSYIVVPTGDSLLLIPLFAVMGLFSFALHQIMLAAVLDVVGQGTEAKAIGLIFGINGLIGIGSPFVASVIIDHLGGYGTMFYYAAALTGLAAVLVAFLPMKLRLTPVPESR